MNIFKKGDVLVGEETSFEEAYHPIVFISGSDNAPIAIVLTHSKKFPCNIKLSNTYGNKPSYFIAHLIEKMPEWGPYKKVTELEVEDVQLIEDSLRKKTHITWEQYEAHTKDGCLDHN